ncbi:MAG: hypothetical protein AB7E42_05095 [Anaerotignaceae bacterium]
MSIFNMLKKHAESLYDGVCTVTEFTQGTGVINNTVATVVATDVPCRLSYNSIPNATETATATTVTQTIKLFLGTDVTVKAGSRIVVAQAGKTNSYVAAGEPAVYLSHQEVELTLKERWA